MIYQAHADDSEILTSKSNYKNILYISYLLALYLFLTVTVETVIFDLL